MTEIEPTCLNTDLDKRHMTPDSPEFEFSSDSEYQEHHTDHSTENSSEEDELVNILNVL
jgi:hypothetical protein